MTRTLLLDAVLLDPEAPDPAPGALLLEAGRIVARLEPDAAGRVEDAERVSLGGLALAPGFLDLHYHGDLVFAEPGHAAAALRRAAEAMLGHGTTGFLPTTVAWPAPELMTRVTSWSAAIDALDDAGAAPLGLHLEGPWIRPEAAGAQPRRGIRAYDAAEGRALLDAAHGAVRMVTFAPELEGAAALLAELGRRGVVAAIGHSLAHDADVTHSVERGARHVTHLFNAMGGLHHRTRGVTGVALTDDRLSCDLICDGVHVHPDVVRLAARAKGERLVLITDRIEPGAGGEGFGSGPVRDAGDALRLADGTLAGSNLTLERALRNAITFAGLSRLEAVAACTVRPARVLGIESQRGTLRAGARADLAVLDAEGRVRETWLAGRPAWRAAASART